MSAVATALRLGRISAGTTQFFLCDMQERFQAAIKNFTPILEVNRRLVEAANTLSIPVVCTEQYPKALGHTVGCLNVDRSAVVAKTGFSMVTDEVKDRLAAHDGLESVVLFGIETHVCVLQTALDLRGMGLDVHVVADACSSRNHADRMFALDRMRQSGVFVTTAEAVIFELLGNSKHPQFKEVQALIKTVSPDSGLVPSSRKH